MVTSTSSGLGHDQDAGGGGVDAALALGDGHPLHPVHAAFVLQPRPRGLTRRRRALGLHGHLDVLVAAEVGLGRVDDLGLPATPFGVAQVHPQQVAGEQGGLLAALPRLDLEDDVAVVVGVARDEQPAQRVLGLGEARLEAGHLGGEALVLGGELAGGRQVIGGRVPRVVCRDGRRQRGIPLVQLADEVLVAEHLGVGQLLLEVGVLLDQRCGGLQHEGS